MKPAVYKRLSEVEKRARPGSIVTVSLTDDPSPEEAQRRIAEAEEEAGPNGTVIILELDHNWRESREPESQVIRLEWE
jgi:hypothetical protein